MEKVQPVLAEKYKMKQGKISSLTLSGGGWGGLLCSMCLKFHGLLFWYLSWWFNFTEVQLNFFLLSNSPMIVSINTILIMITLFFLIKNSFKLRIFWSKCLNPCIAMEKWFLILMHYLHDGFMFTENCLVENIMKWIPPWL